MLSDLEISNIIENHSGNIAYGIFVDWQLVNGINLTQEFPSASLIKSFLFYYALRNRSSFPMTVKSSEFTMTDDSLLKYFNGNQINLDAVLALMVDMSDNTAANFVLQKAGISEMNAFLKEQGFVNTKFRRKFLDGEAMKKGLENTTSIHDLQKLFSGILSGKFLDDRDSALFDSIMRLQFDRSKCALYLPETLQTGGKTGALDFVWNDVMYFKTNGRYVFMAFMTQNLPLEASRHLLPSFAYRFVKREFPNLI